MSTQTGETLPFGFGRSDATVNAKNLCCGERSCTEWEKSGVLPEENCKNDSLFEFDYCQITDALIDQSKQKTSTVRVPGE
jgi:hypothetical protein